MQKKTKKRICLFLMAMLIICSGCEKDIEVEYKDSFYVPNPTYAFYGKSEHFAFETGKVYYGENNEREILITNFKKIKNIKKEDKIEKFFINIYFNNENIVGDSYKLSKNISLEEYLNKKEIHDSGIMPPDGYGEFDAFDLTTEETFKESTKLVINYCYENGECKTENFTFYYVK